MRGAGVLSFYQIKRHAFEKGVRIVLGQEKGERVMNVADTMVLQDLQDASDYTSPYEEISIDRVLEDLDESRRQYADGMGMDMDSALLTMGKKHGFV